MTLIPPRGSNSRKKIIGAINTPLGFFALMALIVEAVSVGWALIIPGAERVIIAILSTGVLLALATIVGVLTHTNPKELAGKERRRRRKSKMAKHAPSKQPPS